MGVLGSDLDAATLQWDGDLSAVVLEWERDTSGAAYREPMNRALAAVSDRDASKLLCDARAQDVFDDEDREWTRSDWTPRAVEAGVEALAAVYPQTREGQYSVDAAARKHSDMPFERVFVTDLPEARAWLGSK